MAELKIKRALISVYDKTGIVDFARALCDRFGTEIISTGGTAGLLDASGIPVTLVEELTGFTEMMDGRVKTLHPKIHAAILADRDNPEHMRQLKEQGIRPIDMVVVNLYPFEKTVADPGCKFEQAIEMIDIGGPCMLRAAAKNHKHVWVLQDPGAYGTFLGMMKNNTDEAHNRRSFAREAFLATSRYDARISEWMSTGEGSGSSELRFLHLRRMEGLRYGENPHQRGEILGATIGQSPNEADILSSAVHESAERMSFNNYADGHAALELCKELVGQLCGTAINGCTSHCCVFVKHTNACGVGVADDATEAYGNAYLGDPSAAMGGILACNFDVTAEFAETVMETYGRWGKSAGAGGFFVEVWIAPGFRDDALNIIRTKKKWGRRVRLLSVGDMSIPPDDKTLEYKTITGGMLAQTRDLVGLDEGEWKTVTKRTPTDSELGDLRLAWLTCKHSKSNAITICNGNMLIGNGAGQMSRVMSCRIATWLAKENGHAERLAGSVAASDAFFPFPDGPNILMDAGVTAIIQPGGSKRDEETIRACNDRDVAMIFTGTRHFRH